MTALFAQSAISDDELQFFLEEEGLVPMRPIRLRWPDLFAVTPSERPEESIEYREAFEPHENDNLVANAAPDPVDYLAARLKQAAVPGGRYPAAILPDSIDAFTTRRTSGVSFAVAITEGPWQGGEIRLRFVLDGPLGRLDGVVRHNLDLLARWAEAVGAGAASDPIDLVARLGRACAGRRVVLDIRERQFGDRKEVYCAEVEVPA